MEKAQPHFGRPSARVRIPKSVEHPAWAYEDRSRGDHNDKLSTQARVLEFFVGVFKQLFLVLRSMFRICVLWEVPMYTKLS